MEATEPARNTPADNSSSTEISSSWTWGFCSSPLLDVAVKRGEHLLGGIEGPVGPTLLVVLETLGDTPVDEGFRGKDDPWRKTSRCDRWRWPQAYRIEQRIVGSHSIGSLVWRPWPEKSGMCRKPSPTSSQCHFLMTYLKQLVPVPQPHCQQITGVSWAASWRQGIRNGIFHDSLFPI